MGTVSTSLHFSQESLLEALRLLIKAHPELPRLTWEIPTYAATGLHGSVFLSDDDSQVLAQYALALGGDVEPGKRYETQSGPRQVLRLHTSFADVPVSIRGAKLAPTLRAVA